MFGGTVGTLSKLLFLSKLDCTLLKVRVLAFNLPYQHLQPSPLCSGRVCSSAPPYPARSAARAAPGQSAAAPACSRAALGTDPPLTAVPHHSTCSENSEGKQIHSSNMNRILARALRLIKLQRTRSADATSL